MILAAVRYMYRLCMYVLLLLSLLLLLLLLLLRLAEGWVPVGKLLAQEQLAAVSHYNLLYRPLLSGDRGGGVINTHEYTCFSHCYSD